MVKSKRGKLIFHMEKDLNAEYIHKFLVVLNRSQAIVEGGVEMTPSYLQNILCAKILACFEDMPSEGTDFSHTLFIARHFSIKKELINKMNAFTAHTIVAELQGIKDTYDTPPGENPSDMNRAELLTKRKAEAMAVANFKHSNGHAALHKKVNNKTF